MKPKKRDPSEIWRVVTKGSDDGTFKIGDHITFYKNGDIGCRGADGWIEAEDVEAATAGMEHKTDHKWLEKRKKELLQEVEDIDNYIKRKES